VQLFRCLLDYLLELVTLLVCHVFSCSGFSGD
jgi:hypothetical protein